MFGMKRKPNPKAFEEPAYTMLEETQDFAYFSTSEGFPLTIKNIQKLKDEGFKLVHIDTRPATLQIFFLCEKIK